VSLSKELTEATIQVEQKIDAKVLRSLDAALKSIGMWSGRPEDEDLASGLEDLALGLNYLGDAGKALRPDVDEAYGVDVATDLVGIFDLVSKSGTAIRNFMKRFNKIVDNAMADAEGKD